MAKDVMRKVIHKVVPKLADQMKVYDYCREWVIPRDLETEERESYVPIEWVGHDGIQLRIPDQLDKLERWKTLYNGVFGELTSDPRINTLCLGKNYLHNGQYPTPDAEIYTAMILDYCPTNLIEIGAGFSTLLAKKAINLLGSSCHITSIDPQPRIDIRSLADFWIGKRVEDVQLTELPIDQRTLIFVDSSHITRARGDVPYLYNRLLPILPQGALIHVHDIFIPYDYPLLYRRRLYTEQYVLHALLSHTNRYEIVFATHYLSRQHPEKMQEVFGEVVGKDDLYYGSSLWFTVAT